MAYENYATVAWTNGTPITADRLQQMSINSDQIKEATDDNPKGVIKRKIENSNCFSCENYHFKNDFFGGEKKTQKKMRYKD